MAGLKKMLDELNKSLDNISEDTEKAAIVVNDAKKNATEIEKTIQATKKDISVRFSSFCALRVIKILFSLENVIIYLAGC